MPPATRRGKASGGGEQGDAAACGRSRSRQSKASAASRASRKSRKAAAQEAREPGQSHTEPTLANHDGGRGKKLHDDGDGGNLPSTEPGVPGVRADGFRRHRSDAHAVLALLKGLLCV